MCTRLRLGSSFREAEIDSNELIYPLKIIEYSNWLTNLWHFVIVAGEENRKKEFEDEKKPVDIGFPAARLSRTDETKLRIQHKSQLRTNAEIEKLARHLKCKHRYLDSQIVGIY